MKRIWTNPSYERSFIQCANIESELLEFLKLKITRDGESKTIMIFPEMEYNFTFYDSVSGNIKKVIGLVTKVYDDQIKIKYIEDNKCNNSINDNTPPMPTCGCILNPPNIDKYYDPKTIFISIPNLINIDYIINNIKSD